MIPASRQLPRVVQIGVILVLLGISFLPVFSGAQTRTTAVQPAVIGDPNDPETYRLNKTLVHFQLPTALAKPVAVSNRQPAIRGGGLITLLQEDFEGDFPAGLWSVNTGNYAWAKKSCTANSGSYSAWAIGGGTIGSTLSCGASYPNSVVTQMIYGPFDLSDANWAAFDFFANLNTENDYDILQFTASIISMVIRFPAPQMATGFITHYVSTLCRSTIRW